MPHSSAVKKYLTNAAAKDLLGIIRFSFFAGTATWTETLDRLVALAGMCAPSSATRSSADRILVLHEWPRESDWEEGELIDAPREQDSSWRRSRYRDPDEDDEEPDFVYFYPGPRTGLSNWEFRPQDADPYPSVPHGHWQAQPRPKLDPYQGVIYNGTKQIGREPKKKIVALWNDKPFRDFALKTIRYHLKEFPYHGDWRVADPLRLPRRR